MARKFTDQAAIHSGSRPGLKAIQLAQLAGVHVTGIKRLERMDGRLGGMTVERVLEALRNRGVLADAWPTPYVRIAG